MSRRVSDTLNQAIRPESEKPVGNDRGTLGGDGRELGIPEGVGNGMLVGKQDVVGVAEDLGMRARFRGAKEGKEPKADSASETKEEKPVGIGSPPRLIGANEVNDPRADSASEAREDNPVGMGMPPRFV